MSFSVIGPVPESGEFAKYKTKQECEQARIQKQEEYRSKNLKVVTVCNISTKSQ